MVTVFINDGKKYRRNEIGNYNEEFRNELIELENDRRFIVKRKKLTENSTLINVYYEYTDDVKLVWQYVQSYETYVLRVGKYSCVYSGYISSTTTKQICKFFNKFCKFDFTYSDVGKIYNKKEYEKVNNIKLI